MRPHLYRDVLLSCFHTPFDVPLMHVLNLRCGVSGVVGPATGMAMDTSCMLHVTDVQGVGGMEVIMACTVMKIDTQTNTDFLCPGQIRALSTSDAHAT